MKRNLFDPTASLDFSASALLAAREWQSEEHGGTLDRLTRVLMVEDDPILSRTLAQMASLRGIQMTVCSSAAEVNALPKPSRFDVALVDYYLEEGTGAPVVQRLSGQTPVVLMSETSDWALRAGILPSPTVPFVHKKNGPERILQEVLRVARGARREEAERSRDVIRSIGDLLTEIGIAMLLLGLLTFWGFLLLLNPRSPQSLPRMPLPDLKPGPTLWDRAPTPRHSVGGVNPTLERGGLWRT